MMTMQTGGNGQMTGDNFRVTLMKETNLILPELWMEVYVASHGDTAEDRAFANMFVRSKCTRSTTPDAADLVVFVGGDDVNPIYYNEDRHPKTFFDSKRDEADLAVYEFCLKEGIPMFGVCRGAQFLHVMNGGKLYQHVDNHTGDHNMWDIQNKRMVNRVSSVHHQMCIENVAGGMEVIGTSGKASERWKNPNSKVCGSQMDVEAYFYRDTHCFGVQGHPEYAGYHEFMQWTLEKINELIVCSPDTEARGNLRRLKTDFLLQRDAKYAEKIKELN